MIPELRCRVLVCDLCGSPGAMADQHFDSAATARDRARLDGWIRNRGRDLCPDCIRIRRAELLTRGGDPR